METGQAGDAEHEHAAGAYGGAISSIGGDRFHAEAVVDQQGALAVYLLGQDVTRIQEVQQQQLTAYVKPRHSSEAAVILLRADPAPGDRQGWTSRFRGQLPQDLRRQSLYITVPGLRIGDERFAVRFALAADREPAMPTRLADSQAEELYLTAGGRYTEADIEENGRTTASERYAGFRASHNFNPSRGDPICPISRTKANPQCSWIIGGETYLFCCPPCIDEFLALAKDTPDAVLAPEDYVQQP